MTQYLASKWNITTGCTILSDACETCLINPYINHYSKYDQQFKNGLTPSIHQQNLELPAEWTTPRLIEISPYSDLFNPAFSSAVIKEIFQVIEDTQQHIYMLTTKYIQRANKAADILGWPSNLWVGTSVERSKYIFRIDHLKKSPAVIKFIEFAPLLENIEGLEEITETTADFITVQRESTGKFPYELEWYNSVRKVAKVPVIMKSIDSNFPTITPDKNLKFWIYDVSIDASKTPQIWTIK